MPSSRGRRSTDFEAILADHERRDEERHAEVMRFMGATQQYIQTSERNTEAMFQGIADLTKLIGSTREKVAEDDGKSKNNRLWLNALVVLAAAALGSLLMAALESSFHLIH